VLQAVRRLAQRPEHDQARRSTRSASPHEADTGEPEGEQGFRTDSLRNSRPEVRVRKRAAGVNVHARRPNTESGGGWIQALTLLEAREVVRTAANMPRPWGRPSSANADSSALHAAWVSTPLVSYDVEGQRWAFRRIAKPTSPTANRDSVAGSATGANVKVSGPTSNRLGPTS
jgi:hypothetical protein